MLVPIVFGVCLEAIVPLAPFFVGEFVTNVPLAIEDVRVFTEEKSADCFQNAHDSIYASFHCRYQEKKLQFQLTPQEDVMSFHSKAFGQADDAIAQYVQDLFRPEDETLARVRANAKKEGLPEIQVGVFDGRHLEILTRMMGAKKAVEIGTLGGYSGISLSRGLGDGGRLHTFEISAHHAMVARRAFDSANLPGQVIIHVGPALDHLASINNEGPFDLVFIDADKASYPNYLKWAAYDGEGAQRRRSIRPVFGA